MKKLHWFETDYFDYFKCKCGACRHPCCNGWRIGITESEYFSMIGRNLSPELRSRMDVAFAVPDYPCPEEYRYLSPNFIGSCHLLDKDGLCMLQKECGEMAIPEVCRTYPRNIKKENGMVFACCTASCEAVTETLLCGKPLGFRQEEKQDKSEFSETFDEKEAGVCQRVYQMLTDHSLQISERILHICEWMGYGASEYAGNPDVFDTITEFCQDLCDESEELQSFFEFIQKKKKENRNGNTDSYRKDERLFFEKVPDGEMWQENLLVNNFFYSRFPYTDSRMEAKESCAGLCMQYALLKLACVLNASRNDTKESFADAISGIYHFIEHTSFYYNSFVILKDKGRSLLKI